MIRIIIDTQMELQEHPEKVLSSTEDGDKQPKQKILPEQRRGSVAGIGW